MQSAIYGNALPPSLASSDCIHVERTSTNHGPLKFRIQNHQSNCLGSAKIEADDHSLDVTQSEQELMNRLASMSQNYLISQILMEELDYRLT